MRPTLAVVCACAALAAAPGALGGVTWEDPTDDYGTHYSAFLGEETCIPLAVSVSTTEASSVDVVAVTSGGAGFPYNASDDATSAFAYPFDEINFPASGALAAEAASDDTASTLSTRRDWCFTPQPGEECSFTVCFEGVGSDINGNPLSSTDALCMKVEVSNHALELGGDGASAEVDGVSALVTPGGGFAMSAWVYASCDNSAEARNVSVVAFKSDRTEGLDTRNSIQWNEDEADEGAFFYYDCHVGAVFSPRRYCCGLWHFVALSVAEGDAAELHVNGAGDDVESTLTGSKSSITTFTTSSRPDNNLDGEGLGRFVLGENLAGFVDEVSVFNAAFAPGDAEAVRTSRIVSLDSAVKTLTFSGDSVATAITSGSVVESTYPGMTPCVLGLENSVGPTGGSCPTAVYGWGFAPSAALKVMFGGEEVRATFVSDTELSVVTPGASPRFVELTATNDGTSFTETAVVGKSVKHLYLESALHMHGGSDGGATADSVCADIPTRSVTFGAWTCPKCGPPASA